MTVKAYNTDAFGVYTETGNLWDDRSAFNPPTDIVGVVGCSSKSGVVTATKIEVTNMSEFEASVGTVAEAPEMYYAVREFFNNGGREAHCFVVTETASPVKANMYSDDCDAAILRDSEISVIVCPKGVDARAWADDGYGYNDDYADVDAHYIDLADGSDLGRIFYVYGIPQSTPVSGVDNYQAAVNKTSEQAAAYWNCPEVESGATAGEYVSMDPCGPVVGLWARVAIQAQEKVAKAPAGNNSTWLLRGVRSVEYAVNDADQVNLQSVLVNYLRDEASRQFVWGASTLNTDANFRLINIARLHSYVRQKAKNVLQPFVFEGIHPIMLTAMEDQVKGLLREMWEQRQLAYFKEDGTAASENEVFAVRCIQNSTNKNQVDVTISYAPVRPAEFIVVTISIKQ